MAQLQTPDVKEMKKALRRQSADKRRLSGARERILHGRQKQALTKGLRTAASDTREVNAPIGLFDYAVVVAAVSLRVSLQYTAILGGKERGWGY